MKKCKLEDLLENKIAVRVKSKEELQTICDKLNVKLSFFEDEKCL